MSSEEKMPSEDTIFDKLGEIPVINDGWTTAVNCYSKVKEFNNLTKFTLNVAESGIKKAAELTSPVVNNYKSQIDYVNDYACSKLEDIETKYPCIKQPTSELKDACLDYVQPVVDKVKPVVTYAKDVVTSGKKKVDDIKKCSTNLVTGACDLGVGTVSRAVSLTLNSPPGRLATKTVDGALSCADGLMDKYMPEHEQEETSPRDDDNNEVEMNRPEQMTQMEPSPERVVVHFKSVSNKLRRRMFEKAMRDFQGAKIRTMEAVGKLHSTVDLIDYAKKNLNTARDKVEDMWSKITETSEEPQETPDDSGPVEQRIVSLGRLLVSRVKNGISALEKASTEAGQFIRHPISKSSEYKDFLYQFSSDMSTFSVQKAKKSLNYIQSRLSQMVDNMESSEWLSVDIDMNDLDLQEEDLNLSKTTEKVDLSSDEGHEIRDEHGDTSEKGDASLEEMEEPHSASESKSDLNSGQETGEDNEVKEGHD